MKSTSSSCLGSNMSRAQPLSTTLSRSSLCCRSYPFRPNIPYVRTYVRVRYFPQPKKRKTVVAGSGGGSGGGGGVDVEERGGPRVVSPLLPPLRLPRVIAVVVVDEKEREHGVAWPGVT